MHPMWSAIVSALHLLALAIGLPAIVLRARALGRVTDAAGIRAAATYDSLWGVAALLWLATGALRAFGPLEKGPVFYVSSRLFHLKLGLFLAVLLLELAPMIALVRWRIAMRMGRTPDVSRAGLYARLSWIEAAVVVVMVFVAAFMARGFGMPHGSR
jgi:putative membrane protein